MIKQYLHFSNNEGELIAVTQSTDPVAQNDIVVELSEDLLVGGQIGFYRYDITSKKVIIVTEREMALKAMELAKTKEINKLKHQTLDAIVSEYPIYKQINLIIDQLTATNKRWGWLIKIFSKGLSEGLTKFVEFRDAKKAELEKNISKVN